MLKTRGPNDAKADLAGLCAAVASPAVSKPYYRGWEIHHPGHTTLAYDDLRDWIKTLEKNGELRRIREQVSPELEITEITDRVSKIGSRGKGSGGSQMRTSSPPAVPRCCSKTSKAIPATRS